MKCHPFARYRISSLLVAGLLSCSARAATYYWDGTNTVANNTVDGGTGSWNVANTNWTNAGGTVNNAWVAGSDAIFAGTAGTVTLSAQTVGNVTFTTSGYLLTSNSLTFSNGSVIDTGSGTATINSTLAGTGLGVSKVGSGMLILGGNNTVSGTFNLTDGTVVANNASNGKAVASTVLNIGDGSGAAASAVFQFGQNNNLPFSNSTVITINSDGRLDLNGKTIGGSTTTSNLATTINFAGGGAVVGNGASSTGGGAFNMASNNGTGSVTLTLSGSGTYSGAGGNLTVTSGGSSLTLTGTGGTATLAVNNGASIDTQGGNIILASGNAGGSTVSGNTVLSSLGGGSINTGTGALIFATGTNGLGTATSSISRSGTAGETSALTIAGNIVLGAPGGAASQSNRQLTLNSTSISNPAADNMIISAVISDGAGNTGNGLLKNGGMSVALTGTNTYTGTTTITQGALYAKEGIGLPTNSNMLLNGGVFESNGTVTRALGTGSGQLVWTAGGFSARGGDLTVAVGGTAAPTALVSGVNFSSANSLTFGSSLTDGRTLLVNNIDLNGSVTNFVINDNVNSTNDYTELSGAFSGSGQLLKSSNGLGLLYLSNNANSSAATTLRLGGGVVRTTANAASLLGGNLSLSAVSGNVAVLETSGTFSRSLGNSAGTVQWAASANGGFAAYGDDLHVRLNNSTATVTIGSTANFVSAAGSLTFGSSTADHTVYFDNGLGLGASGSTATINVISGSSLANAEVNFTGTVSGAANLLKTGSGRMVLSATNSYTGTTTVSAGTLLVNGAASINSTAAISVNGTGAVLRYDSSVGLSKAVSFGASGGKFTYNSSSKYTGGALMVGSGATVSGTGALGAVTIASGGVLAPGNSPGNLTTDSETWAGGGSYQWEINNASGTAGVNWDLVSITAGNTLSITADTSTKFTISLNGLTAGNVAGTVANFDNSQNYVWTIATVGAGGSILGFDPAVFTLDTSNFTNNNSLNGGSFSLATSGNNLNVVFTAVPEPSTYALVIAGLMAILIFRRKRSLQ